MSTPLLTTRARAAAHATTAARTTLTRHLASSTASTTTTTTAPRNRIFTSIRNTSDFDTARLALPPTTPLLTLWTASWCQSCRAVTPLIHDLVASGVGESPTTAVAFAQVELDSPDISDVATRYMLSSIPTLLSFRRGEAHMAGLVGDVRLLQDRAFLIKWIEDEARGAGSSGGGGGLGKSLFGGFFGALPFRGRVKQDDVCSPWA